jgi:hypothetical protein
MLGYTFFLEMSIVSYLQIKIFFNLDNVLLIQSSPCDIMNCVLCCLNIPTIFDPRNQSNFLGFYIVMLFTPYYISQ